MLANVLNSVDFIGMSGQIMCKQAGGGGGALAYNEYYVKPPPSL